MDKVKADNMRLYHYTNEDIPGGLLKVGYYGNNSYTYNDRQALNVKRLFFYLVDRPLEYIFKCCQYCFTVDISDRLLYDLRTDQDLYLIKFNGKGLKPLIQALKKKYKGIIYNAGGLDIVNIFEDIQAIERFKRF